MPSPFDHGPFDHDVSAAIESITAQSAQDRSAKAVRAASVAYLEDFYRAQEKELFEEYRTARLDARALILRRSALIDALVRVAFAMSYKVEGEDGQTYRAPLSLLAVGGYGRSEMAPQSDVDLLFLCPDSPCAASKKIIETQLYILWDLKLKVGHASRSIDECIELAREDITIRTALLEHRFIAGDAALAARFDERLWSELFETSGPAFIAAKLAERTERHRRQGSQRYVLEPNVKEGKGGLRDLQTLYWIGKYLHRVGTPQELVTIGLFSSEEYEAFRKAEDFLWAVRCHMHYITGRPVNKLTFDLQVGVAEAMGYVDTPGRRAVENFMQDYFRHATRVGDLTRIFLTELEARHAKPISTSAPSLKRRKRPKKGFAIKQGRITVSDPESFVADKLNLLRVFEEGLRLGLLLHPDIMRLIATNLPLIDEHMRSDPEAARIFLDLLLKHGNPERALRRMNELGVLGAFIPEFGEIIAMMQFNMYHHYTVDEHTIQCISVLAQIERRELVEELPVASSILERGVNRKVLYVALLLHDIGKGRSEDHAILGARLARKIAPRLGLTPHECETVEWLVRMHLVMSDNAQKRDIGDPRTVRAFAKAVQDSKRLDLLTVLTVCDIRGVGPGTWNNWKAMLLRQLFADTAEALNGGLESFNRRKREGEAKKALAQKLHDWPKADLQKELARHYTPYWQNLPAEVHEVFARSLRGLGDDEIRIDLRPEAARDATRAAFALVEHPGIFSRLSGALALVGANVVDARSYTSKDGYTTAVFWIQDSEGSPYDSTRLPRLRDIIDKTLKGVVLPREALKERDKVKKREREFRFPTHITFDNEGSDIYSIIEVDTRDRPGLLYDLTRTLAQSHVYIVSAVVATYGAQVVDSFYVKDMFGLKLYSKSKRDILERRLRIAISEGAERAIK